MGGFQLFNMRKAFVSLLWEGKETPSLLVFFLKLEGAFCLVNSLEIHLGFDWW